MPQTPAELAAAAHAAVRAGACAVHLHPRSPDGRESLLAEHVGPAIAAVREVVDVPVGVTTIAWTMPDPVERRAALARWSVVPDVASVNVHEDGAMAIAGDLIDRGIAVEVGLWTVAAARQLLESGLHEHCAQALVEPIEQAVEDAMTTAEAILRELAAVRIPRLLHGFEATAWALCDHAVERGLPTRIGLEDTLVDRFGRMAADTAAMVSDVVRSAEGAVDGE